jgi:hypothetical protein
MVNVTNRTDVAMRLIPLKLFLGHGSSSPLIVTEIGCSLWRGQASQSATARPKYRQIPRRSSEKNSLLGFCDGFMKKHGKTKPERK